MHMKIFEIKNNNLNSIVQILHYALLVRKIDSTTTTITSITNSIYGCNIIYLICICLNA